MNTPGLKIASFQLISLVVRTWFPTVCQYLAEQADDEIELAENYIHEAGRRNAAEIDYFARVRQAQARHEEWVLFKELITGKRRTASHRLDFPTKVNGKEYIHTYYSERPEWDGPMIAASTLVYTDLDEITWTENFSRGITMKRHTPYFDTWLQRFEAAYNARMEMRKE